MSIQLGVVMDPIENIKVHKDTTLALLLEAQRRGWAIHYMKPDHLFIRDGVACAEMQPLQVRDSARDWFRTDAVNEAPLRTLDTILMRQDPPFDMEFFYATHILELAEAEGVLVVNRPRALRDVSEKLAITHFPQCCVPTLVSRDMKRLRGFFHEQHDIVLKPLDGMGGTSVFRLAKGDPNASVIFETITDFGQRSVMAQRYLPEISGGDKRILMVDGEPVPYALARIPAEGESRANLAAGGQGEGRELTERDRWICSRVAPMLKEKGVFFAGLDVIGDYLTEINVTSPTCVRELDRLHDLNISAMLLDVVEGRLDSAGHSADTDQHE